MLNTPGSCYSDPGDEYYWEVNDGAYAPAFTGQVYYSSLKKLDGTLVNTMEFGIEIFSPQTGTYAEGDSITLSTGVDVANWTTYESGDTINLAIYGNELLWATGGEDGNEYYTWKVSSTNPSYVFPNYYLSKTDPNTYHSRYLSFNIVPGILPYSIGDSYTFAVEGGHYSWRKNGGAWSINNIIQDCLRPLSDGLNVLFSPGPTPSFVIGDWFEVNAMQEWSVDNVRNISLITKWKGDTGISVSLDPGTGIDVLIMDGHNLTSPFILYGSNSTDFTASEYSCIIPPNKVIMKVFDTPLTYPHYQFLLPYQTQIGYLFMGSIMRLSLDADNLTPNRKFTIQRSESTKEPFSLFRYANNGYDVNYSSFILNEDFMKLDEMINYLKENDDMSFYFIPNLNTEDSAVRVKLDVDSIDITSTIDLSAPVSSRLFSLMLPLKGV